MMPGQSNQEELVTVTAALRILDPVCVCRRTVYRAIESGEITAIRYADRANWRVSTASLRAFRDRRLANTGQTRGPYRKVGRP
ncbi:MAG: helix-turn-helix domain-containing protein [Acidobacteriia bacterium]|nr:helix-turn-helix domain-containing protein [Terriglobia bacterium]